MQKLAFMSCLFLLTACQATSESEPAATEVIEPSFDCQKAQGQVEILICNDQELAALDRQMSEVYQAALVNIPASAQPKAGQSKPRKGAKATAAPKGKAGQKGGAKAAPKVSQKADQNTGRKPISF